jgi:FAD/FMN-containing dehydrogenase
LDDAELWKNIAAARVSEGRIREAPSGTAKVLMERIKRQLDPKNILAAD